MNSFQNRVDEINTLCHDSEKNKLYNVYGETGIGKSRLLNKVPRCLKNKEPAPLLLHINLENIDQDEPETAILQAIVKSAEGRLTGLQVNQKDAISQIVARLIHISVNVPVCLLVDTTEEFQENMSFWAWMEEHVVGPLVSEGHARLIFAGRVPVPWRRYEVRRVVKYMQLEPLKKGQEADELVREVLQRGNSRMTDEEEQAAVDIVLEFSFGHPKLSEDLAGYVAKQWPPDSLEDLRQTLCEDKLKPFINDEFFKTVEPDWKKILWWSSALDWFDATIFLLYLKQAAPKLINEKTDFDFIQGITRMRIKHRVVYPVERGERLHGILGDVVKHCLQVLEPDRYAHACQSAAQTFAKLADEFSKEAPEIEADYRQEAAKYKLEGQNGS